MNKQWYGDMMVQGNNEANIYNLRLGNKYTLKSLEAKAIEIVDSSIDINSINNYINTWGEINVEI